jgi:hypothetical protein
MAYLDILARQQEIDATAASLVASAGACRAAIESGSSRFSNAIKLARKRGESHREEGVRSAYSVAKRQLTKANDHLEEAAVALLDAAILIMQTSQECYQAQSILVASCVRFANRNGAEGNSMHAPLPPTATGKRRGAEPAKAAAVVRSPEPGTPADPLPAGAPAAEAAPAATKSPGRKRGAPGPRPGAKRTRRSKKDIQAALEESVAAKSKMDESATP